MCVFAGKAAIACNAAMNGSGTWGLSNDVCQAHFAYYRLQLANGANFAGATTQLDDCVRLLGLMNDDAAFRGALLALSSEMSQSYGHFDQGMGNWGDEADDRLRYKQGKHSIRISRLLSYYEGYCWFPDTHANYAGLLDAASFEWGLTMGLMPKDPGAGAAHGDFSHRLQWHVVMRIITQGFESPIRNGWNHSPLELFTFLGSGVGLAARLWFFLFDNNTSSQNSLGHQVSMHYSNPDAVNALVSTDTFGMLGRALEARWDKRRERQAEGGDYVSRFLQRPGNLQILELLKAGLPLKKKCNGVEVTNLLYHWRKLGGRPVQPAAWLDHQQRFTALALPVGFSFQNAMIAAGGNLAHAPFPALLQFYTYLAERIAYEYWQENIQLRPLSAGGPTNTTPQGVVAGAPRVMSGILTDPSVALGTIANRVASSRNRFNRDKYQKTYFGVTRKSPDA